MFTALSYQSGTLKLIDQRQLPHHELWIECQQVEQAAVAIEDMVVRGAPAIGCVAAFALALDVYHQLNTGKFTGKEDYRRHFASAAERLSQTRPTAVNLFDALAAMQQAFDNISELAAMVEVAESLEAAAIRYYQSDLEACRKMAEHGFEYLKPDRPVNLLTHCNTGSLATAGYGTALGVVRRLHLQGMLKCVYLDETRPYLQGARLSAFEMHKEGITHCVIPDGAAAYLMSTQKIDLVIVGADRIAVNGDTANKIGTFHLAVAAAYHKVPFFVAAPITTFDRKARNEDDIPIELRNPRELSHFAGQPLTPEGSPVWNPSFDVTPAHLIQAYFTEVGVLQPPFLNLG